MTSIQQASLGERIRHRFPIFERRTYINSCSQGALSDAVRSAYDDYLRDWDDRGAPWDYWLEQTERARGAFAALVGAERGEIAVTTSLSAGVSALASAFPLDAERKRIVLSDFEFPTVGQIWHAQELRGAQVEHVLQRSGEATIPLERFDEAIDERTALVAITHVCYRNGAMLDVPGIVRLAHERGALVLLDAYQSLGTLPLDVRSLDVDFLASGVLKYLLGSAGLGFLYCRRDLVERLLPTQTGWLADEDVFAMNHRRYSPSHTASRFESGTPPIPSIYAGVAGMELMQEIGIAETREHVQALNDRLTEGVDGLGGRVVTPREHDRRGALVCIASSDPEALVAALAQDGVVTSSRDGNLRVSAHCYNTAADVDAVLAGLARRRDLLA